MACLPRRALSSGSRYPRVGERCIYFYSTFRGGEIGQVVPFYMGRQRHAFLMSSGLSLLHYLPWWSRYLEKPVRCDLFAISEDCFARPLTEREAARKFMAIEALVGQRVLRRFYSEGALLENHELNLNEKPVHSAEVQKIADTILKQVEALWL